jgi:ATP diphosphatase
LVFVVAFYMPDGLAATACEGSSMTTPSEPALTRLLEIMARLRAPVGGCPWDQLQGFETIAPYTVEEAYEVVDAIGRGPDMGALLDELGDLLFQVVYHARMAEEVGAFGFGDVAEAISSKMIRRHPHVFGEDAAENPGWETMKQRERAAAEEAGVLAGVPVGLPALTRALKLTRRAARVGFDWPDADSVLLKLDEEVTELRAELPGGDPARLGDELGDMLFVLANLGRKLGLNPEACLQAANAKFARRFNAVEARLGERGVSPGDAGLAAMEAEWQAVKVIERDSGGE